MRLVLPVAAALAFFASAQPAKASALTDYTLFVFGDWQALSSTTEGAAAIGGNATLGTYDVGLNAPSGSPAFVVGGNLNYNRGRVFGSLQVGGNLTTTGPVQVLGTTNQVGGTHTINSNFLGTYAGPAATPLSGPLAVDFAAEAARFTSLSSHLAQQPQTGTATLSLGNSLLLSTSGSGLQYFNLSQAIWDAALALAIHAPADASVIVNVDGVAADMSHMGMSMIGGINETRVIYNFHEATTLHTSALGVLGSILAPHAAYTSGPGLILGSTIVASYTGSNSIQHETYLYAGELPSLAAVNAPEPASLALFAFALAGLAARRARVWNNSPSDGMVRWAEIARQNKNLER